MKKFLLILSLLSALSIFAYLLMGRETSTKKNSSSYRRIVSLAPSFSETIEALKEDQRLVGITTHCHIANAANIKKIGNFASPNLEAILGLKPDLVLAVPHVMAMPILKILKSHGIEVLAHQPDTLADIKYLITKLADKLLVPARGQELNNKIDQALLEAKKQIKVHKDNKILLAVSHSPLVIAGKNTFASEIVEYLGFVNQSTSSKIPWPVWPLEKLIDDPPACFIALMGKEGFATFKELNGYKKTTLIIPQKAIFSIPSPSIIDDIKYFTQLILDNNDNN